MQHREDRAVGIIPIYKKSVDEFLVCLVKSAEGDWGFPKGHVEPGESDEQAAHRELREETGIENVELLNDRVFSQAYSFEQDGAVVHKTVDYWIGFADSVGTATPKEFADEIADMKWLSYDDAAKTLSFDDTREILANVWQYVHERLE